jgi:hypothetical protein
MKIKATLLLALLLLALASLASAETIQKANLRIDLSGQITPQRLPRDGTAPVKVAVGTKISAPGSKAPAQLKKITIAINRHGTLDSTGLPVCELEDIQPATTQKALSACRGALVGEGSFSAAVSLAKQASFPSQGKLFAFNGVYEGRPAILAHVYGTAPVPTSFTLPFVIGRSKGTFATTLTATFPATDNSFVTGIDLTLHRTFTYRGKARSYASAGCPLPRGVQKAAFPFAKASYEFVGGKRLSSVLTRSCRAGG